jgi:hypothetical protein
LSEVGPYFVFFQLTALGSGHLVVSLNGVEQTHTLVTKNHLIQQVVCGTVVTTTEPNTVLSIRNPNRAMSTLRLIANEGGPLGISNHLVIIAL